MAMDPVMAMEVTGMLRQRAADEATARGDSEVQSWYSGTTVFLTGGSGFLGKQLAEKLLRACDVNKIYILLRAKKGKKPQERFGDLLEDHVFDKVRKQKPDFADKITVVEGDVAEIRLGLNDLDWEKVTAEVNVIFHVAATTRFNDPLQHATLTNVRGTREALRLGKACKNLKSFVHVSTAFSHATQSMRRKGVLEQFYASPVPPDLLIEMAETLDESMLDAITPHLLQGQWINTYTFTKVIAEDVVRQMGGELPICVIRPAIVVCTYREPTPGWLDMSCAYGPTGIIAGFSLGVFHVILADIPVRIDLVPADLVNNATLAAAWQTAQANADPTIYTVTSRRNPIFWEYLETAMKSERYKIPPSKSLWFPCGVSTTSRFLFWLMYWLFHYIPAYIADGVAQLFGKNIRAVYQYSKGYKMMTTLAPFTLNHWDFDDSNLQSLQQRLSPTDRQIFNFDITELDNNDLLRIWCLGTRKYIFKEDKEDIDFARKKLFWLRILHYVVCALYAYLWWTLFSIAFSLASYIISLFKVI